jgi:pyridoxamine 5'-phosphate oxidase
VLSSRMVREGLSHGSSRSPEGIRREYAAGRLDEREVASDPVEQFRRWFEDVLSADLPEPTAMTLATASASGRPSARMVLLKGFDERGFVFYTSYESRKGRELDENPRAALVFWWPELERQVRIEGRVERLTAAESDAYFRSRPPGSQLAALVSRQSRVVPSREELERQLRELEEEYRGREIPRPPYWGGYRVVPEIMEFWAGRENRMHDRLRYRRSAGRWILERLAP